MYEKYPWHGPHTRTHMHAHAHARTSAGSSSSVGRYRAWWAFLSSAEPDHTREPIVLMGFLSGTPALICIQPCAAHPRNSFLEESIMIPPPPPPREWWPWSALHGAPSREREKDDKSEHSSRATPSGQFSRWSNNGFSLGSVSKKCVSVESFPSFNIDGRVHNFLSRCGARRDAETAASAPRRKTAKAKN